MTIEMPPDPHASPDSADGIRAGWWGVHWRSVVIVGVIVAAMAWALWPKARPTVELPAFEQKETRLPEN